jgi:predicted RNase H-like HicB family nuclease
MTPGELTTAIQFRVRVPISLEKEGNTWVASCLPLDVVSQGETEKEATENLAEAVSLFIETSYTMGTLDEVLTERGFSPVEGNDTPETGTIDVPLPLLVARKHAQAHAS